VSSVLDAMYADGFNFEIVTKWDLGISVKLGDSYNGYKVSCVCKSFEEAEAFLALSVIKIHPTSQFATEYKHKLPNTGDSN